MAPAPVAARRPINTISAPVEVASGVRAVASADKERAGDHHRAHAVAVGDGAGHGHGDAPHELADGEGEADRGVADAGGGVDRPDEQCLRLAHAEAEGEDGAGGEGYI